jgi:hypothetical protein
MLNIAGTFDEGLGQNKLIFLTNRAKGNWNNPLREGPNGNNDSDNYDIKEVYLF